MKKNFLICMIIIIILILNKLNPIKANIQTSKLNNKNIVFLGDSLTSKTDTKKYINYIEDITGANCVNYSVGGSTVAKIEDKEKYDISFSKRYKDIITDYPDNNEFWDFIIIFGGINDYAYNVPIGDINDDSTTFYGALNEIIYELQSYYTKAKIIIMTPLIAKYGEMNFEYTTNEQGFVLKEYRGVIKKIAGYQSCIVFETSMLSGLNPNNKSIMVKYYDEKNQDGVHPNPDGHKRIAIPLKSLLESLVE